MELLKEEEDATEEIEETEEGRVNETEELVNPREEGSGDTQEEREEARQNEHQTDLE